MPVRIDTDWSFVGAVMGFVLAVTQFVLLMWLSFHIDGRDAKGNAGMPACLLRMTAWLGLAFGTGLGYVIGRWWGGG